MRDNVLPPGGSGKQHRSTSAIENAIDRMVIASLPFFLPGTTRTMKGWLAAGITRQQLCASINRQAAAGRIAVVALAPENCIVVATAVAAFPADCPTTTVAGDVPAAPEEITP